MTLKWKDDAFRKLAVALIHNDEAYAKLQEIAKELVQLETDNTRLRERLKVYGRHLPECTDVPLFCDCGLLKLKQTLAEDKQAREPKPGEIDAYLKEQHTLAEDKT